MIPNLDFQIIDLIKIYFRPQHFAITQKTDIHTARPVFICCQLLRDDVILAVAKLCDVFQSFQ